VVCGVAAAWAARRYMEHLGIAGDPAPRRLWWWVGLCAFSVLIAAAGWPGSRWFRRNLTVFAASLCLLSTGLTINGWIGYFPTVSIAWNQLTGGPLPGQTDRTTLEAMQAKGFAPPKGALVKVITSAVASHFTHRDEWVYLPPVWFATNPPPRLPTVMMIAGEFHTPADWVRAGDAVGALDSFAAAHGGTAPVAVFVDSGGAFTVDTECVNGQRGNAADHLTKDVVPYLVAEFGVSAERSHWGVAGFSSGGTCALDLAVMHPELFHAFVDIAGDPGPNAGTKEQTVDRLFGGDTDAWASFDPASVIEAHDL
jgi:S-formylglutathione hydrolase FrmB